MSEKATNEETAGEQSQASRGAEKGGDAASSAFPGGMEKMKEMMAGKGCGPMMKEMMSACCGKAGSSEDDSSKVENPRQSEGGGCC